MANRSRFISTRVEDQKQEQEAATSKLRELDLNTALEKTRSGITGMRSESWRSRTGRSTHHGHFDSLAMISESQVSTFNSKLRRQKVYRPQDFEVGVIFTAPWFEADSNKQALESGEPDYNRSMTSVGPLYTKHRKYICIGRFTNHVLALPIYTHGGKGLSRKRASQKDEFISIREYDSQDSAAPSETPYDILWVNRYPEFKGDSKSWYAMTDFTSAHFTKLCVHKYDNKCTIQGKLKPQSKKYLQTLVTETLAVAIAETRKFAESTTIQELQNLSLRKPSIKPPANDFGKLRSLALNRRSGVSVHSRTEKDQESW